MSGSEREMTEHEGYVALVAALLVFGVYRRFRRNFGRQKLQPRRMTMRVIFLGVIGAALLLGSGRDVRLLGAALAGLAGGAALAGLGLRATRFDISADEKFYTPDPYIGAVLSTIFLGRLFYRFFVLAPVVQAAQRAGESPYSSFQRSPLTLAIFMVLISYYGVYTVGVLRRARQPAAPT
jgi:hypothetical protein